ncbi:alcohol dehydrogenase [Parageobacillus thermoglucosidasius]|uniref:long-chain-alcohol dehydrogenase n=3 Tax=Parageobacillus thermoglucosidasius TaxID=1426 RepID=A0AAN0YSU8_PARTM|nr:Alcohol dehydrogenase [Parageobacillus thermoglucosidasius C56-YS93]ALF12079.1 alcohol dehydrogenase [Parageobacillus thermoglucosidasius]REK53715.1 MAG: alcohol dehydrogenase [Geobacillus sp.]GAJ45398.1 putaive alcohol dehydrogenase [Parageobacillus thermoglucosidasius NBRC 107763]ANZ32170.1 alcohol dehydrogenase [Parageobacillus thermoglucosidasius]
MNTFFLKPKIYFGNHSLNHLSDFNAGKVFIVTDQTMLKLGMAEKIIEKIKGAAFKIFPDVEPNPSIETVKKAFECFLQEQPELVIALGGGSAIDAAKAMLLFYHYMKDISDIEMDLKKPLLIAIPTTSGTGSEMTSYSVITDTTNHLKIPLRDERMLPDVAILDEQLTITVPPSVTADTGMDVLTHAIEAYVSLNSSEFTDIFAERSIKMVFNYLLRAYRFGEDLDARGKLHIASCMAGIAFTNSSLGINHSLAHAVGAKFHLPHGRTNAILLPYVIQYNSGLCDDTMDASPVAKRYTEISKMLGLPSSTLKEGVISLVTAIQFLNKKLDIPSSFKECDINETEFAKYIPSLAKDAMQDICTAGNPRKVTEKDFVYLLKWAYNG